MPASNKAMIHKLQKAINENGGLILLDKAQFFSDDQNRPITKYKICTRNSETRKKVVLFETSSQIQIVFYLRDYWFWMNGKEVPKGTDMWEDVKKQKGIVFTKEEESYGNKDNKRE